MLFRLPTDLFRTLTGWQGVDLDLEERMIFFRVLFLMSCMVLSHLAPARQCMYSRGKLTNTHVCVCVEDLLVHVETTWRFTP